MSLAAVSTVQSVQLHKNILPLHLREDNRVSQSEVKCSDNFPVTCRERLRPNESREKRFLTAVTVNQTAVIFSDSGELFFIFILKGAAWSFKPLMMITNFSFFLHNKMSEKHPTCLLD